MGNYKIKWEIDVEASSHEEAAAKALEFQQDKESIATVFEVTDDEGNTKEIDTIAVDNVVELVGYINRVIREHGDFSTFDVEADGSPTVNVIGNIMQLAESFYEGYATCITYIGSREESEQDLTYAELAAIDPFIIEQIASLAGDWEAECMRTEKRISD